MWHKNSDIPKDTAICNSVSPCSIFLLQFLDADCYAAAGCKALLQHGLAGDFLGGDDVILRIGTPVCFLAVGIDGGFVFLAFGQEAEVDDGFSCVFVGDAADVPLVLAFCLAGYGDVVARFGFQDVSIIPVYRYVFDELESVEVLLVALIEVGSHLERAVHRDVEGTS